MKGLRHFWAVCLVGPLAVLASCSCAELETEIDAVWARSTEAEYAPGEPMPLEVGQWVVLRVHEEWRETFLRLFDGETQGFIELAVTGQEGGAFWVERRVVWSDEDLRMAFLVEPLPDQQFRVLRIKVREGADGEPLEFDGDFSEDSTAGDAEAVFRAIAASFALVGGTGRTREVIVPAGRFTASHAIPISYSTATGQEKGHVWFTSAVPVVGFAKKTTRSVSWIWLETVSTTELVDFGLSGARSLFD